MNNPLIVNGDLASNEKMVNGEMCDNELTNGNENSGSHESSEVTSPLSPNSPTVENGADSWSVTNGNSSVIGNEFLSFSFVYRLMTKGFFCLCKV